jgi:4-amino-4-deoxy-L-arabinose transferase
MAALLPPVMSRFFPGAPIRAWSIVLCVAYLLIYLAPLGIRPLSSPDEVRYGAISHEMIATGDWVSPRFNGVRYFEKPIMGYWLNSLSMAALGESPFALRLPTALSAGLTALIVALLGARFAGRRSALMAAGIYLSTFLVLGVGTLAVFDTFLTLFLTAALASYWLALSTSPGRTRHQWLVVCGAACGAAFLTKGFLALAIPVVVAGPFLLLRRRWRDLLTTPWLPIVAAAIVVAPWALWIHLREPDFWHYFFWIEHIQRFLGDNAQHAESFWYYFLYAPLIGLPWIWVLPAALRGLRDAPVERGFVGYLACWLILPWLFFSASRGKLVTYVLPCLPALALLLSVGLESYWKRPPRRAWQIGVGCVALFFVLVLAALVAAQRGAFGPPAFESFERAKLVFMLACLTAGLCAAVVAVVRQSPAWRMSALGATGALLFLAIDLGLPKQTLDGLAPSALLDDGAMGDAAAIIVADASTFGAVAWYTKRDDIYVLAPGEIAYGMEYPDSRFRNLQDVGLAQLIADSRGVRDMFIVVRPENAAPVDAAVPGTASRTEAGGLVRWHIPATTNRVPNG